MRSFARAVLLLFLILPTSRLWAITDSEWILQAIDNSENIAVGRIVAVRVTRNEPNIWGGTIVGGIVSLRLSSILRGKDIPSDISLPFVIAQFGAKGRPVVTPWSRVPVPGRDVLVAWYSAKAEIPVQVRLWLEDQPDLIADVREVVAIDRLPTQEKQAAYLKGLRSQSQFLRYASRMRLRAHRDWGRKQ